MIESQILLNEPQLLAHNEIRIGHEHDRDDEQDDEKEYAVVEFGLEHGPLLEAHGDNDHRGLRRVRRVVGQQDSLEFEDGQKRRHDEEREQPNERDD